MKIEFDVAYIEEAPAILEERVLYVSLPYATVIHLCACGCRSEVVTPLAKSGWRLSFDGQVSLSPSIGNWRLPCRSHYYIVGNEVRWVRSEISTRPARRDEVSRCAEATRPQFAGALGRIWRRWRTDRARRAQNTPTEPRES